MRHSIFRRLDRIVALALTLAGAPALAQDPVLVPPLPLLAPVEKSDPVAELQALRGIALPPPPATVEPATAAPALAPADGPAEGPADTDPTVTEAPGSAGPEAAGIAAALGRIDPAALDMLSRMSRAEIDALSTLILSQTPQAAAAPVAATGVLIQAGSFRNGDNAQAGAGMIMARGLNAIVEPPRGAGLFRLLAGPVPPDETGAALRTLAGIGFADAFVLPQTVPMPAAK